MYTTTFIILHDDFCLYVEVGICYSITLWGEKASGGILIFSGTSVINVAKVVHRGRIFQGKLLEG